MIQRIYWNLFHVINKPIIKKLIPKNKKKFNKKFFKQDFELQRKFEREFFRIGTFIHSGFNFTQSKLTSPQMSLVLNYIQKPEIENLLKFDHVQVDILDDFSIHEITHSNKNFLGINFGIIFREILIGFCTGPEHIHIWNQRPLKRIALVRYMHVDGDDVWEWEKDLTDDSSHWQVRNINGILG